MVYVRFDHSDTTRKPAETSITFGPYRCAQIAADELLVTTRGLQPVVLASIDTDGTWSVHDGLGDAGPTYQSVIVTSTAGVARRTSRAATPTLASSKLAAHTSVSVIA